jgi:ribonuclease VapC
MVIDSSALLAILLKEPEKDRFVEAIALAPTRQVSAGTWFETGILAQSRQGDVGTEDIDRFIEGTRIRIVPFDLEQAQIAREAYRQFGKGNHRAGLNFGDCFAYALAKANDETLLFKGADFARTDIERAV